MRGIAVVTVLCACHASSPPPLVLSENWCDRVVAGSGGNGSSAEAARAHAGIRFFGPVGDYPTVDAALVSALASARLPDLDAYAAALAPSVCALDASPTPAPSLPPASVVMKGSVALIHPGSGAVTLPAGARSVAIDLRDLPAVPELDAALQAAIAPALATALPRSGRLVRNHIGMDDEVYSPGMNVYKQSLVTASPAPLAPLGTADLPIMLLTSARLPPRAAEWAGELRLRGRASLVGASVMTSAAESEWSPIGARGLMWRAEELQLDDEGRWPDEIAADVRTDDPLSELQRIIPVAPIDVSQDPGSRAPMNPFQLTTQQPEQLDLATMRAAFYVLNGALRLFYPYFPVIGDDIDDRLDEILDDLDSDGTVSRPRMVTLLRRFANAIHDGHSYIIDPDGQPPAGYLPAALDWYGDEPVVHTSLEPLVHAGDTIAEIDGMAAKDWYEIQLPSISAATDGAERLRAGDRLTALDGPRMLTLRDPTGATRQVTVQPSPQAILEKVPQAPTRQNGTLADLGDPDLYYFNLDASVTNDPVAWNLSLMAAQSSVGVVLDMRGYPDTAHFNQLLDLVGEWIGKPWLRPQYTIPKYQGPNGYSFVPEANPTVSAPVNPSLVLMSPLVWLVGPFTQSAAEDFSIEMVASGRVKKVVGRTSAGTDGNITGLITPGGFSFSFTGMDVHFPPPDGREFDALGIVPDVIVPPSPSDLAAGIDSDLAAAIQQLRQ